MDPSEARPLIRLEAVPEPRSWLPERAESAVQCGGARHRVVWTRSHPELRTPDHSGPLEGTRCGSVVRAFRQDRHDATLPPNLIALHFLGEVPARYDAQWFETRGVTRVTTGATDLFEHPTHRFLHDAEKRFGGRHWLCGVVRSDKSWAAWQRHDNEAFRVIPGPGPIQWYCDPTRPELTNLEVATEGFRRLVTITVSPWWSLEVKDKPWATIDGASCAGVLEWAATGDGFVPTEVLLIDWVDDPWLGGPVEPPRNSPTPAGTWRPVVPVLVQATVRYTGEDWRVVAGERAAWLEGSALPPCLPARGRRRVRP